MTNRDKAVQLAQTEVVAKTWGVTAQFLAVNKVVTNDDGEPTAIRVDEKSRPDSYLCYFAVHGEPYFLVVVVESSNNQLAISGVYMEAGVRAYLLITSKTMTTAEISTSVGLPPSKTHSTGEPISKKNPNRTYKENLWIYEPQAEVPGSVEEKLNTVLNGVESRSKSIASLKPICEVHVNVVYEGWGGDCQFGGFHFNENIMSRLCALGAELNFDLYAFGPKMPED